MGEIIVIALGGVVPGQHGAETRTVKENSEFICNYGNFSFQPMWCLCTCPRARSLRLEYK